MRHRVFSLASNALATVVILLSEGACERETLLRRLNGTPNLIATADRMTQTPTWHQAMPGGGRGPSTRRAAT